MDPDTYRRNCLEKLQFVQEITNNKSTWSDIDPEDIKLLANILCYLKHSILEVIEEVHDLWSARQFQLGYSYGNKDRDQLTHDLLLPYENLENKKLENDLGIADMDGILKVLVKYYPQITPKNIKPKLTLNQKSNLLKIIGVLSDDQKFLLEVGHYLHQNWSLLQKQIGVDSKQDPRVDKKFEELEADVLALVLENTRTDILALALYIKNKL